MTGAFFFVRVVVLAALAPATTALADTPVPEAAPADQAPAPDAPAASDTAPPDTPPSSDPQPPASADAAAPSPAPAPSSDGDLAAAATDGEVIVVTGTRSETPLSASPVVTEVIDRKRLEESGVQTVAEALALRPGLWTDRSVAGTTGITIQGLGPQYSLILVDGARQIGRTDGTLDLDRFGIGDIEQIEIVRGPSSALYGADALGGVVNIITRKPSDGFAVDAATQVDGRLAHASRARISLGKNGLAGALTGELRMGPAIRRDDASDSTTISEYEDRHINGRVTSRHGENWRIDGSADYLRRDLKGVDASGTGAVFDRRNLVESASGLAAAQYAGERTALRLSAGASLYRDQYLNDQRGASDQDTYQVTDENLLEGSAQVARELGGGHRGVIGGELLREALDSDRISKPGSRVRGAIFAQDEWRIGPGDQLMIVPAGRIDLDSQFGTHVTPRLAARWQVQSSVVIRASGGFGYHAPSFKDLLLHFENPGAGYVIDGNPDLQPETSRNIQAGAEWQATPWLWLSGNGFYNALRDLITPVTKPDDGSGMLQFGYGNIGRARTTGLESYAMATRGRAGLELGYALTRARDFESDRALEGIPPHRFTITGRWRDRGNGIDGFAAAVITGGRPLYLSEDPQRATVTDRRFELRARVAKRFPGGIGGFVGVDNLLDAGDADLDRIPPRTVYAGVEFHR